MSRNWFNAPAANAARGMDIIRIAVALILSVHGFNGLIKPDRVSGFGGYLGSVGFPLGVAPAW